MQRLLVLQVGLAHEHQGYFPGKVLERDLTVLVSGGASDLVLNLGDQARQGNGLTILDCGFFQCDSTHITVPHEHGLLPG